MTLVCHASTSRARAPAGASPHNPTMPPRQCHNQLAADTIKAAAADRLARVEHCGATSLRSYDSSRAQHGACTPQDEQQVHRTPCVILNVLDDAQARVSAAFSKSAQVHTKRTITIKATRICKTPWAFLGTIAFIACCLLQSERMQNGA